MRKEERQFIKIEKAETSDNIELTKLTFRSKAHWGYSAEQLKIWEKELTIKPESIIKDEFYKATIKGLIIGYYSYFKIENNSVKLDNIFIEPEYIGHGFGEILMDDFFNRIKEEKYTAAILDADPKAEGFYRKLGFEAIGQLESSIVGRFLPIMKKVV